MNKKLEKIIKAERQEEREIAKRQQNPEIRSWREACMRMELMMSILPDILDQPLNR